MIRLIFILFYLLPTIANSQVQVIADTVYASNNAGGYIKYVTYRNATTTIITPPTRLRDSMLVIRGLLSNYATTQSIPNLSGYLTSVSAAATYQPIGNYLVSADIAGKQNTLVSGTNIKTVNGNTLLGSGNLVIGGGVAWGAITGPLSAQADLQSALDIKQSTITQGTTAQYLRGNLTLGTYTGYAINVQALTSSPVDAQTIYFGTLPKAPVTVTATSKIYVRAAGTITGAEIYCYSGTAGTAENWSVYIRVNNTTDYLISTVGLATSERIFTNNALSISLSAGDYFEIKAVNPTWVTNPLTVIFGGYIKIN